MNGIIYVIRNVRNNHQYVGSTGHPTKRWPQHQRRLRKNKHHSPHLQAAWNKYGESVFVFEILEEVNTTENLWTLEQAYITQLKPEYNVAPIAGSPLGIKRSRSTREKLRKSHTGVPLSEEHKQHIRKALVGRTFTKAWAEEIQAAKVGRKRSPETCHRISAALQGRKINPAVVKRMASAHRGLHRSEETREKMRQAQRQTTQRQIRSDRSQLSWTTVLELYRAYAEDNVSLRSLAQRYRISTSYLRAILHQKNRPPDLCPDNEIRQQLLQYTFSFRSHRRCVKLT